MTNTNNPNVTITFEYKECRHCGEKFRNSVPFISHLMDVHEMDEIKAIKHERITHIYKHLFER